MTTVAAVSFHDNRQISMDVEAVETIILGRPMQVAEGQWFCELVIQSANGTVALQMLADAPDRFHLETPPEADPADE
jgi:hypothetical protein